MKNTVILFSLFIVIVLASCAIKKTNNESIILRYHPVEGAVYDLYSNVNIALDMAQPVNINMDLFSTVSFKNVKEGESFSSVSKIERVKSIASSSIFHRSYDSDNPLLENDIEKQMHDQFSKILNLDFKSKQNSLGEKLLDYDYDSIFGSDEKVKAQFKELEQSISITSLIYPEEKVKEGTSWLVEVKSQSSIYPVVQKITYTVTEITPTEVYLSLKGIIVYETNKVEGGGEIEGQTIVDRNTGIVKTSKQSQVMTMKVDDYKATSVNSIEVKNVKR